MIGFFGEHFPYTNFHDLNLDWIVRTMKAFGDELSRLADALADIDVMTPEEIQALIDASMRSYEVILKAYVDNVASSTLTEAETFATDADNALAEMLKAYADSVILNAIYMFNPFTGSSDDIRDVINDVISYVVGDNALTAGEYDALLLTAAAYDAKNLTAYQSDFNGANLLP